MHGAFVHGAFVHGAFVHGAFDHILKVVTATIYIISMVIPFLCTKLFFDILY